MICAGDFRADGLGMVEVGEKEKGEGVKAII